MSAICLAPLNSQVCVSFVNAENGAVKKSYFYENLMAATAEQANQICQAFGMTLASPQSQAEFDQLKKLLFAAENIPWTHAVIAGYRSEEKTKKWLDSTHEIKYGIDWNDGEPNNSGNRENCIGRTSSSES